jgi:hypothetical protein
MSLLERQSLDLILPLLLLFISSVLVNVVMKSFALNQLYDRSL